jgi:hypothetical protein
MKQTSTSSSAGTGGKIDCTNQRKINVHAAVWKRGNALGLALELQLTRVKVASQCLEEINSMEGSYLGKLC